MEEYDDIMVSNLDYMFDYFKDKEIIGVDSETEGFDVFDKNILLLQLGDYDNQFVIDCTTINIEKELKEFLEDKSKVFIYHNAKFDLKFLFHRNIIPFENVYDTFLAERVLTNGDPTHRKSLQECVYRYFKVRMSKEERGLIHKLGIYNSRIITYSALDVKYLIGIRDFQLKKAKDLDVTKTIKLENLFVSVLTYVEYGGIKLDVEGWREKSKEDLKEMIKLEEELNEMVISMDKPKYLKDPDLFNPNPSCNIMWSSQKQVIPLFEELGLNLLVVDKKTGKEKKSIESKVLASQMDMHPIIPLFTKYQKAAKLVSTYGMGFLDHINPKTGRIHTNFNQIINTGRLSSGKEDPKNAKPGEVNMQNIPSGRERTYFVPDKGNSFVVADYSSQETRVLCYYARDEAYSEYITDPEKDLHSFMARLIFPKELGHLTDMEIKDNHPDKRQFAKSATFAIPYGGTGYTIAVNLGISPELGEQVYDGYMKYFKGLKKYFDEVSNKAIQLGYVLINPKTGRKWFLSKRDIFKATKSRLEAYSDGTPGKPFQGLSSGYWNVYREEKQKDSVKFKEMKAIMATYFKIRGTWSRIGLNSPVQGTSADMSKLAGVRMFRWILDNNLFNTVKICVPLHDEYAVETPEHLEKEVSKMVQESMESAAEVFCPDVGIKAKPVIGKAWDH